MGNIKTQSIIKIICLSVSFLCAVYLIFYLNEKETAQYSSSEVRSLVQDSSQMELSSLEESQSSEGIQSDMAVISSTQSEREASYEASAETSHEPSREQSREEVVSSKKESSSKASSARPSSRPPRPTSSKKPTSSREPASSKESSSDITTSIPSNLPSSVPSSSEGETTPSSIPPFESEQTSSEPPTDAAAKENAERAAEISADYGIKIIIAFDEKDFSSGHIQSYALSATEVKNGLSQIKSSLKDFPTDFFSQTSTPVQLVLVSQTTTQTMVQEDYTIILPCFKTINAAEIRAFLLGISAQNLSAHVNPSYDSYNPPEFLYGNPQSKYNYNASQPATGYFLSSKAQESPADDLYETFVAIFDQSKILLRVPKTSPYYRKLEYTCQLLFDWADCFGELAVVKKFV